MLKRFNIIAKIVDGVSSAKDGVPYQLIHENPTCEGENQYCFFLKPGATVSHPDDSFIKMLEMVLDQIKVFGLCIQSINVLSGPYLSKHRIVQQHYGLLYRLAEDPISNITPSMRVNFLKFFNKNIGDVQVMGGVEFLEKYTNFTASSLDILWANIEHWRLGAGGFCGKVYVQNEEIYLINGFTPYQLSTYTPSDHALVVFTLTGLLPWKEARQNFLGNPDPSVATIESLRRKFFQYRKRFRLKEVSLSKNCAHLSAGPVEALIELCRFRFDFELNQKSDITQFAFGQKLVQNFSKFEIDEILKNPIVQYEKTSKSLFDCTESVEEKDAIKVLMSLRSQLGGREI